MGEPGVAAPGPRGHLGEGFGGAQALSQAFVRGTSASGGYPAESAPRGAQGGLDSTTRGIEILGADFDTQKATAGRD